MKTQDALLVEHIIDTAAEQKASDLHLSVGSPPILRLGGRLVPLANEQMVTDELMQSFIETILTKDQQITLERNKEIVLAYEFHKQARFRINIYFQKGVLAAYLRYIGNRIMPLQKLGLPNQTLERFAALTEGLLIISGAFGSGKTTTSASLIDHVNRNRSCYILTIEKPIEYVFANQKSVIEQREVGRDAVSFEQALSNITQEDVDVLFVSELPNAAVTKHVLNIAASGRLVIANLEAETTVKTLELIISNFPADEQWQVRNQLASNLAGTLCQRLIPRIGGGEVAIAEIMTSVPAIQAHIKEGSLYQLSNVIQTSREEGMVSLDWSLAELVKTNEITLDDAIKYANDPQQLRYILRA